MFLNLGIKTEHCMVHFFSFDQIFDTLSGDCVWKAHFFQFQVFLDAFVDVSVGQAVQIQLCVEYFETSFEVADTFFVVGILTDNIVNGIIVKNNVFGFEVDHFADIWEQIVLGNNQFLWSIVALGFDFVHAIA